MRRNPFLVIGGLLLLAVAAIVGRPIVDDERERKVEVYRAFFAAYPPDWHINLSNKATKFSASTKDMWACAPTVIATTAISRHFRTLSLTSKDFAGMPVRLVDATNYARWVDAHEPAFGAGLWEVSDVGFDLTGRYALLEGSFRCGVLCGWGGSVLFERVGKKWVPWQNETREPFPGAGAPSPECGSSWSY